MVFIPQAQPHAQSLFLFPIVFGINMYYTAEAPFSGGAAGASWSTWNDPRRSIVKPAAYASTKTSEGVRKDIDFGSRQEHPLAGG